MKVSNMITIKSLIFYLFVISNVESLMLYLPPNLKKCLKEEIHKDILVKGDYEISHVDGHETRLDVTDSRGHILYKKENAGKGKFAFTTDEYDVFQICFETKIVHANAALDNTNKEVSVHMKHGVEAKDYENLAKAEKLKPLEVELRRLEDLSQEIVNDFNYMKIREEEMRNTNESTNSKVLYFSIFSMCCLLGLAVWQVLYLRRYFKAKKLIE